MVCCVQEAQHDTQTAPSLDELHVQDEEESDLAKDPKKVRTSITTWGVESSFTTCLDCQHRLQVMQDSTGRAS